MASNPYESPADVEPLLEENPDDDWGDHYGRGSLSMFVLGGLLGAAITAGVCAVGAGVFAAAASVVVSNNSESWLFAASGWTFIGALVGAMYGAALGAVLGVVAAMNKARARRRFSLASTSFSALIGGATFVGMGAMLMGQSPSSLGLTAIGLVIGTATGVVIGWLLARVVAGLCWGPPPRQAR